MAAVGQALGQVQGARHQFQGVIGCREHEPCHQVEALVLHGTIWGMEEGEVSLVGY